MSTSTSEELVVVIGAGSIGQTIARRIGVGKTILLADLNEDTAAGAATTLQAAGFNASTVTVDVASHDSVSALASTAGALGLAMDELNSPAGAAYQRMIKGPPPDGLAPPDEIGATAAFLMGRDGSFITGTDLLIDGGVIASIAAGRYQLNVG